MDQKAAVARSAIVAAERGSRDVAAGAILVLCRHSGQPRHEQHGESYAATSVFNYTYTPGSGEDVISAAAPLSLAAHPMVIERCREASSTSRVRQLGLPACRRPRSERPARREAGKWSPGSHLHCPTIRAARFHVLLNPPANVANVSFSDPSFAGTITPFGHHGGTYGWPCQLDIPLTGAINKFRPRNRWDPSREMRVQVVADTTGITVGPFSVPLKSISIRTL